MTREPLMTQQRTPAQQHARLVAKRRLGMFLWSLPVVGVLLFVAFWLFGQLIAGQAALAQYAGYDLEKAEQSYTELLDPNIIEPYLPYFDRGATRAAMEDYTPAIDDFERALELAPFDRKCVVRINLALSWERLGDQYMQSGLYQGALLLYEAGMAVIAAAGEECPPGSDEAKELDEAEQRLEQNSQDAEELRDAAAEANGEEPGGSTDEQLEQLEQKGQASESDKAAGDAFERGDDGESGGYVDKPW